MKQKYTIIKKKKKSLHTHDAAAVKWEANREKEKAVLLLQI